MQRQPRRPASVANDADGGAEAGACAGPVAGHWLLDATVLPDGGTSTGSPLALMQDGTTVTGAFCYGAWKCDTWDFHGTIDCNTLTLDQDAVHIDNELRKNHFDVVVAADGSSFEGSGRDRGCYDEAVHALVQRERRSGPVR